MTFVGGDHIVVPPGPVVCASKEYVRPLMPRNVCERTDVLCFHVFHEPLAILYRTSYLQAPPALESAQVTGNEALEGFDGAVSLVL
jgi:hypothetical protein